MTASAASTKSQMENSLKEHNNFYLKSFRRTDAAAPLLFGENVGRTFANAGEFYDFVRQWRPAALELPGGVRDFSFKGSMLQFSQMRISTSASDACRIKTATPSSWFSLVIPTLGNGAIGNHDHKFAWSAAENILINPLLEEQTFTFEATRSQVLFEIDPARLLRTIMSMQGSNVPLGQLTSPQPQIITTTNAQRRLKHLILTYLPLIDATGEDAEHLGRIGFDDVIIRLIVELTFPAHAAQAEPEPSSTKRSQRALKLICEMIVAADALPLTMTEMKKPPGSPAGPSATPSTNALAARPRSGSETTSSTGPTRSSAMRRGRVPSSRFRGSSASPRPPPSRASIAGVSGNRQGIRCRERLSRPHKARRPPPSARLRLRGMLHPVTKQIANHAGQASHHRRR